MRRIERVDAELDPAALFRQALFEQRIQDMMARITFVAAEIDRSADSDRQVGVDLDETTIVALVIIIA